MALASDLVKFDNSMLSSFKGCPRLFYNRYLLGLAPNQTAKALIFGRCWHSAMDVVWKNAGKGTSQKDVIEEAFGEFLTIWKEEGLPSDPSDPRLEEFAPRTPLTAIRMLEAYVQERWNMLQESELLACEFPFEIVLDEERGLSYVGRMDKVVKFNNQRIILEHKTTTLYSIKYGFQSAFVDSFSPNSQVDGYLLAAKRLWEGRTDVWVDAALVHKTQLAFKFIPVARSEELLGEFLKDAKRWTETLLQANKEGFFQKNTQACTNYGRCSFFDTCRFFAQLPRELPEPPEGFHFELWDPQLGVVEKQQEG